MEQNLVLMFDELGDMYEVENIDEMLTVVEDTELISIYKSTVYEHKLTVEMERLVGLGYFSSTNEKTYNAEAGELGIKYLTEEAIKRFGEDNQKRILSEIDLTWEKNKPAIPAKRKKKKQ
jgi:hypothetical protein